MVLATDGVLDNLYDKDVLNCIKLALTEQGLNSRNQLYDLSDPQQLANCIADTAEKLSWDKTYDSPFAKGAREAGRSHKIGGKDDDITVVVAQIKMPNTL